MTKYLFSYLDILIEGGEGDSRTKLFPGDSQYEIFIKIFHKVIDENIETFLSLGVGKNPLRTHSAIKVKIILVRTGCNALSPMALICLHACFIMEPVKDRYIHYEKYGDKIFRQTVTGISSLAE